MVSTYKRHILHNKLGNERNIMHKKVIQAREFALKAHGNQKYAGNPYITHLDDVVTTLLEFNYHNTDLLAAGYLHDVLEDTKVKDWDLDHNFGMRVMHYVIAVTGLGDTRAEKTAHTIENLEQCWEAIPLKMADRLSNMRFSSKNSRKHIETYRAELPLYESLFKCNMKMYEEMKTL